MVIIKLKGGLGNQMFQYALALIIANRHKTSIKFDLSLIRPPNAGEDFIFRDYSLDIFGVEKLEATPKEISMFNKTTLFGVRILRKVYNYICGISYIEEKKFSFNDIIPLTRKHTYLNGYWQSEKYYESNPSLIKNIFKLNTQHQSYNKKMLSNIMDSESVSIFVRRQEYVYNERVNRLHGVLPINYYQTAVEKINSSVIGAKFFIFSDDLEYFKYLPFNGFIQLG